MRKLGVDEWLIETVMATYKDSNSAVRVNNTVGEKFNVEVGMHQGSVLSPLLLSWFWKHYEESSGVVYLGNCSMQMIW